MSSLRFSFATWALGLSVLAGCPQDPASVVCPGTGIICPEGTYCGAVQPICLTTACGNGVVDPGEECDDGNVIEGDNCSPICRKEICGNGVRDPQEICDDNNTNNGDGCSANCLSKEVCGNGILDADEKCDDGIGFLLAASPGGATESGTTATFTTTKDHGLKAGDQITIINVPVVGFNGSWTIVTASGATFTAVITMSGLAPSGGGAGWGASLKNGDGCSGTPVTVGSELSPAPCKSTEVCGNGIKDLQVGEVCDDGNTNSGDGCNSDCRSGEGCGNGIVDPGEQCDDGNANNNDDCLNTCKIAKCGDGIVDNSGTRGETCDAGTTGTPVETATCNIDCTTRICGDRKVNQTAGEQCDDGIGGNGDTKNCTAPAPMANPARPGCQLNRCGDGLVDMTPPGIEQCDDGNTNNLDGCSNACELASCGNSTIDPGEQCDDGNTDQTDACVSCHIAVCGDGFKRAGVEQCDDGNTINGDNCSSTCRIEVCGNMIIDPGELCDDGNASNTDACTNGCQLAVCGDRFVRAGIEQCDDGNTINGDGCSMQCRLEGCGNGTLDPGEQCDDGNTTSGDGCSATCRFEGCGNGLINVGEACDGTGTMTVQGVGGETATCNADCTLATCGDGKTNATRGEQCDAGPGLNANDRDCTAMCKINICTDGHVDTKGPLHFEFCDDGNMIPTDGCNNSCTLASCGNGLLDPGEQCDDNNNVNTDACNGCQNARCGDGVVRIGVEQCDGGANCSANCTIQICGNGIIDPGEECDDNNLMNGDGCSGNGHPLLNACKFEFCGDKLKGTSEVCDYTDSTFGPSGNGSCNRDCTPAMCGDGKLSPFAPSNEQCDLGTLNNALNLGCSPTCQLEHCGDGNVDTGEQCDQGASNSVNGPCLPWCRNAICGDGVVESASAAGNETCDLGTLNGATTCAYGLTSCSICSATTCQPVTLSNAAQTRYCGDGTLDSGANGPEACDNGTVGSAMFPANGTSTCPYNTSCTTCKTDCTGPMMPTPAQCGDMVVDGPTEKCDFGATNNTTTLPTTCAYNSSCTTCPAGCATPTAVVSGGRCGDGIPNGPETCDNGAANSTDVNCPWAATLALSMCTRCSTGCGTLVTVPHYCGDGQCDVGFEAPGGCIADCGTGQFVLTVVKTGAGGGTVTSTPVGINCGATCTQSVASGAMVSLAAVADGTSTFVSWGGACSGNTTCSVTMSAAKTVTANFAKIQRQLTVTKAGSGLSVGSVTVMPAGTACGAGCSSYDDGTVVVLTATPGANNNFTSWAGCDSTVGTVCIVTANGVEAVTATFTLDTAMLAMTVVGAGTVTSLPAGISCPGTCSASFDVGAMVTLNATATGAGVFNGFSGDCTTSPCVMTAGGRAVTATFTP